MTSTEQVKKSEEVRNRNRSPKLNVGRLTLAEFGRAVYVATPEKGVTLDDMKEPSYWGHIANRLKPNDRIEAVAEDGEFFVEFIVMACGTQWAKVVMLRHVELNGVEEGTDRFDETQVGFEQYDIMWGGNNDKFRVVRKDDNEIVHKGSITKVAAQQWLADYIKALGN